MTPVTAHSAKEGKRGDQTGRRNDQSRERERHAAEAERDGAVRSDPIRQPPCREVADDPADAEHEECDGTPRCGHARALGEIRQQQRVGSELRGHLQQGRPHGSGPGAAAPAPKTACARGPVRLRWCRARDGTRPLPLPVQSARSPAEQRASRPPHPPTPTAVCRARSPASCRRTPPRARAPAAREAPALQRPRAPSDRLSPHPGPSRRACRQGRCSSRRTPRQWTPGSLPPDLQAAACGAGTARATPETAARRRQR